MVVWVPVWQGRCHDFPRRCHWSHWEGHGQVAHGKWRASAGAGDILLATMRTFTRLLGKALAQHAAGSRRTAGQSQLSGWE